MKFINLMLPLLLSGCYSLYFYPDRNHYPFSDVENLPHENLTIHSYDGLKLASWRIPADSGKPLALVVQFHGNAENMTSHYASVAWLRHLGYEILTFDYRGYGDSEGDVTSNVGDILHDVRSMLSFAESEASKRGLPLVLIGQSIGGSLLLRELEEGMPHGVCTIMIESSFPHYRAIAIQKLKGSVLTWPFFPLAYVMFGTGYDPGGERLRGLAPGVPVTLMYSEDDSVVGYENALVMNSEMREPKEFWHFKESGHVVGFYVQNGRFRDAFAEKLKVCHRTAVAGP